jgi:hypothetical protein
MGEPTEITEKILNVPKKTFNAETPETAKKN